MSERQAVARRFRHRQSAFSLVEVVLAIGVVTLGLLVIMALIPSSFRSSKQSSEDLALSLMIQSTVANLHKQGLTTLAAMTPTGTITYYYDADGSPLTNATGAIYSCNAKPILTASNAAAPVNSTNFIYVQLQFAWPISAPIANQQTSTVITSIGNHD